MAMVIVDEFSAGVTGGVDTHLDTHVAAALDPIGGLLGVERFDAGRVGEARLIAWLQGFGPIDKIGVEGTGSYGAGLARRLQAAAIPVVEVDRPNRQERYRHGKSDPADAIEAARAAQSGRATGQAKSRDGNVEAMRALLVARRSARSSRIKAMTQVRHLGFCAPDELRERLDGVSAVMLGRTAAELRPAPDAGLVVYATATSIRILGRRIVRLEAEITMLEGLLDSLVKDTAPSLLALHGVGTDTAATLLVAAGDNPERLRSEAAWAHLCGVAPIQASSGKVARHRLNRGGDRNANQALWRIALTRMSSDDRTRAYVERRTAEGKSKREILRCLKRYIAREVYPHLRASSA
jgi:transposase